VLHGFKADNGAECVNHQAPAIWHKPKLNYTRSRPGTSNDNGLAETKNGAIIRKQFGYTNFRSNAIALSTPCVPNTSISVSIDTDVVCS